MIERNDKYANIRIELSDSAKEDSFGNTKIYTTVVPLAGANWAGHLMTLEHAIKRAVSDNTASEFLQRTKVDVKLVEKFEEKSRG